jgi:tRNA pseudouridine55 synthase
LETDLSLDGLLLIDKPTGITSHDVVREVRRALGQSSVGHTGTLDPLATGLMVLVLGEATKLSDYLLMSDKSYRVKIRLGMTTDTLDRTGRVLTEKPCDLAADRIRAAAGELEGEFDWPVPLFSATRVEGKKLYEYGREGAEVALPVKRMSFWNVEVEEAGGSFLQVRVHCSKGSFIRTWAAQLGERLGVGGCVEELTRLTVGPWSLTQAAKLEGLSRDALGEAFVPMSESLPQWKVVVASGKDVKLVTNGQIPRDMVNRLIFEQKQAYSTGQPVFVKVLSEGGGLLAIVAAEPGQGLKIRRVFRGFT